MKMPSGIQTYRCGTSRTPSPTEKTATITNASVRDVEDAVPYRKSCQEYKCIGAGCRGRHFLHFASQGRHPLHFASQGHHLLQFASQGRRPLQEKSIEYDKSLTISNCSTVEDAIPYGKAARNTNTIQRDVEDAVPYRKNCHDYKRIGAGRRSRTPSPTGKAARNADTT